MLTAQSISQWLPRRGTAVCAVSGGLDSMCLLHLLETWCREQGVPLIAAHFHHGLRTAADRDEAFVRDWCASRNIPFTAGREDVGRYAALYGLSLEEAARERRYAFLRRTAAAYPAAEIYTAHHAGDNAETVLLNLFRGTGLRGLTGMRHRREGVVRPLLAVSRAELEEYAAACKIPHVEDETNADPAAASRNLLRLEILPLLRELNPRVEERICETARQLAQLDEDCDAAAGALFAAAVESELPCNTRKADTHRIYNTRTEDSTQKTNDTGKTNSPGCIRLRGSTLLQAPRSLRPRILQCALETLGVGRKDFSAVHWEAVLALLETPDRRERRLDLPHGVTAYCDSSFLTLETRSQVLEAAELPPGLPVRWGQFRLTLLETLPPEVQRENCLPISMEKAGCHRITVGPVRPGSRLELPGFRGSRTIKRLCLDRRISLAERDALPAVYVDGYLAAVWRLGVQREFSSGGVPCQWIFVETMPDGD